MSAASFVWERPRSAPLPALPAATFIFWGAALHAAVGLAAAGAWAVTGNAAPFELFRNYPGAIFLVELAAVQFRLTRAAGRQFAPGEPLSTAWLFMMAAAACQLTSAVFIQVLGADTVFNPLARSYVFRTAENAQSLRDFGAAVGGPMQMALAACGIGLVLRVFRVSGLLARPGKTAFPALVLVAATAGRTAWEATVHLRTGAPCNSADILAWVAGLLAGVLVLQGAYLYASAAAMGRGFVARCWMACGAAAGLTALGDVVAWISRSGLLPPFAGNACWYTALAAGAAYALAPAWQVDASTRAAGDGQRA